VDDGQAAFSQKVTREELGRCTWTLLHTLASTFPDDPTRRQRRDVKSLVHLASSSGHPAPPPPPVRLRSVPSLLLLTARAVLGEVADRLAEQSVPVR
jgi:hypothetical protein